MRRGAHRTISPVAEIMPGRGTPEYERTGAKMGAFLRYRRARSFLEEFFPLGDAPEVETILQRTLHVGARLERKAVAPPTSAPPTEAQSIALAIDGEHACRTALNRVCFNFDASWLALCVDAATSNM